MTRRTRRLAGYTRILAMRIALAALLLAGGFVAGVQTLPEFVLFRDRLLVDLFDFESRLALEPLDVVSADGLTLRSWYRAPEPGKTVIVYFPGRRGDAVKRPAHLFDLAEEEGYGLALAGYRGYGGNPGRPSESRLYADAAALTRHMEEGGLAPDGLVLYGYSMGTGIASHLSTETAARGLILEAPFTSFAALVHNSARLVPARLVRSRFDTASRFEAIHMPILLLAGQEDRLTPPAFAELLATVNAPFASLHVFPGAGHDTLMQHGAAEHVRDFLAGLDGGAGI